jgi:hypothetical protein
MKGLLVGVVNGFWLWTLVNEQGETVTWLSSEKGSFAIGDGVYGS